MKALEEIKARLAAMEPGQWEVVEDEQTVRTADGEIMFDRSCEGRSHWNAHGRRSAEFIAHSPETQAKLIAALEAVRQLAEAQPHFQHFGGGKTSGTVLADSILKAIAEALA